MRRIMKRALFGVLLGGGVAIVGATVANAAETSGDDGLLSGTQTLVSLEAPVTVGGNAISVIGDSSSSGATTAAPEAQAAPVAAETSGDDSILGGTQALVDIAVPVTVSGNAISVIGDSWSENAETAVSGGSGPGSSGESTTNGDESIAGGTQVQAPVTAPVTVGGNAISGVGDSSTEDASTGVAAGGSGTGAGDASTSGDDSIAGGTQVIAPVTAPVTVGGNAISGVGDSKTDGASTVVGAGGPDAGGAATGGDDSVLGGTQVIAPITVPITVGGNAISGIGDGESTDSTTHVVAGWGRGSPSTSGDDSIGGGTQLLTPITLPITVDGIAVCLIGDCTTSTSTNVVDPTDPADPTDPTDPTDPGDPTDPTDPGDPTDPTDPGDPTDPTDPGGSGGAGPPVGSVGATARVAADADLAMTGGETVWSALLLGVILLGGGATAIALRRRVA